MRRPTVRRQQPGVALFPFLAVLICTMGSLIVLLVLVVQQTRASGAAKPVPNMPDLDPDELKRLTEQQEDLQWRANVLKDQREQYAQELADKRAELAHLEDHIRRLEDQARKLMAQAEELKKLDTNRLADLDSAHQQLAEMEREIKEKKEELDKARKEALRRRPAYAIVPYDGPNGTSRRPMYIECSEKGVLLQPEGIPLAAKDFQGPLGPGNPLDAALRAIREHWQANGLKGEPYPLIIVRPDGAIAFGACRSAMKHWESEFGYELVDQDAELKFPPADRQLAATLERAIEDARQRQTALAAAMPNRFGAEAKLTSFRAADNVDPDEFGGEPGGQGGVGGRSGSGVPSFASGGTGKGTGPRGATGVGGSGTSGISQTAGSETTNGLRSTGSSSTGRSSNYAASGSAGDYGERSGPSGSSSGQGTSQKSGGSQSGGSGTGSSAAGGGGSTGGTSGSASQTSGVAGGTSATGSAFGQPGMTGSSSGGNSEQMGSQSVNASVGSSQQSAVSPQMQKARKAIKRRGENWGLPNASAKATAVVRPIYVECYADRLLLIPERGEAGTPLVVPVEDSLQRNLDAVVAAVWQRMDRWGLAVLGGYWKPVLTIDVKPGGEERFEELQQLLRGSGIEVERKSP